MKKNDKKTFFFAISLALLFCLMAFQNCSQTNLEEGETLSSGSESIPEAQTDSLPFAYQINVDHIGLMTCPNANRKRVGEFTFKWGAYRNGLVSRGNAGLKLTDEFLELNKNNVDSKKYEILQGSAKNANLQLVSAFYSPGNYLQAQQFVEISNGLINETARYSVNKYWEELILNKENGAHFFPMLGIGNGTQRLLEGKLFRASVAGYQNSLNDEFSSVIDATIKSKSLVLGFSHAGRLTGDQFPLISSDGSYKAATATGTSYTFSYGRVGNFERYLTDVLERDVSSGSVGSTGWNCPSTMRFKIVQRGDMAEANCSPAPIVPELLKSTTEEGRRLRSLANIVDLAQWEVDMTNRCLVRKQRSLTDPCYERTYYGYTDSEKGVLNYTRLKVDYAQNDCINQPFFESPEPVAGQHWQEYRVCPHYVSICVKSF